MHIDNSTEKDCVYDDSARDNQYKERQLVDVGGTAEVASSSASICRAVCGHSDAMSLLSLDSHT